MPIPDLTRIRATVFDMDGVLVDSEPLHMRAANRILARFGAHIDEASYRSYIGTGEVATWSSWCERFQLPSSVEEIVAEHTRERIAEIRRGLEPIPGATALARRLHGDGHPLALASSSARDVIAAILTALHLDDVFAIRVSGEDPEVAHSKPAPDVYLRAAERLGVAPRFCLAIEDSGPGVAAAKAAGMICIAVPNRWTEHQEFGAADAIVAGLGELEGRIGAGVG